MRLPSDFEALEPDIESVVMRRLTRGSVTITIRWTEIATRNVARINVAALEAYAEQLRNAAPAGLSQEIRIADLLSLPGVVSDDRSAAVSEAARPMVMSLLSEACDALMVMRCSTCI
jgi:uncharacterized protein YicC (UPF0701 family)